MSIQTAIRIYLPNRSGELLKLGTKLAQAGINIEGGAGVATGPEGPLELVVSDKAKAEQILREQGIRFEETQVVLAWVKEKVGGLVEAIEPLSDAGINIESLYLVRQEGGLNLLAIGTSDPTRAEQLLNK